jgi:hypothetical protein
MVNFNAGRLAIVAVAWQAVVILLVMSGANGILYDMLARYFGIPWNAYTFVKFWLGVLLMECPLLLLGAWWDQRR